jgi:toxin ParE1/3/4
MSYRVSISSIAERDIASAVDYVEFALKNPVAADHLLDVVETRLASLSEMPSRTRVVDDPVLSSWRIRCIAIENYLAFYVVDDALQAVTVVRFLHQKSNWNQILRLT